MSILEKKDIQFIFSVKPKLSLFKVYSKSPCIDGV